MIRISIRFIRIATILALAFSVATGALAAASRPQESSTTAHPSTTKKKKSRRHHSSRRESFQKAPTPERISEIQSALSRGGYYQGDPNGKWDSNTVSALEKFQSANGMNASGKLDAPSLQKLGLGSSTAGVDAPKPLSHTSAAPANTTSASAAAADPAPASASNVSATQGPSPSGASATAAKPPQR
jgi:peptidoglycan hydrolase-like protein with peptidoglycan-binding domain